MNKNPIVALLLAIIPGAGHFYLQKYVRGLLYSIGAFLPVFIAFAFVFITRHDDPLVLLVFFPLVWVINMFDMIVTLTKGKQTYESQNSVVPEVNERFFTILLSFIPGLGHFQLGLMQRGLTFLVGFFGLATMVMFIAFFTREVGFFVFLGLLPIIWIYSFFDAIQHLNKKQQGMKLEDRTILEDFEDHNKNGKKSKAIATVLSIFPGAGHMYLGLQRRGLQLMAAFLFSFYILDVLRLSIFLFLLPIIWFYSFFDGLQKAAKHGEEPQEDIPVVSYLINHQKWVGIGLLVLGCYYLWDRAFLPAVGPVINEMFAIDFTALYHRYFQTLIVSLLLIGGGIKLILGSKQEKGGHES